MTEAFLWANDGGAWSDPSLWRIVEVTGLDTATPIITSGTPTRIPEHGPTAADTVVFANFDNILPPAAGPLIGGGSAAHVYTLPDFGPIVLGDVPGDGAADVYTFGDVHLNTRVLSMQGSILQADSMVIDGASDLDLSVAGVSLDPAGRTFSAEIQHLTLEDARGQRAFGQITFGIESGHNIISSDFLNENGGTASTTGAGAVLGPAPPPVLAPPPVTVPAEFQHWLDIGTQLVSHFQVAGLWPL